MGDSSKNNIAMKNTINIQQEKSLTPASLGIKYMKLADTLRKRGYDVEADMAEKDAE